jgi:hypothetical protein
MLRTWKLFASLPHPTQKTTCMESRMPIVQVESEQWRVHSPQQTQLEKKPPPSPPPIRKKGMPPSHHDATSHWLDGNSIPKIGCFWPGLIPSPS